MALGAGWLATACAAAAASDNAADTVIEEVLVTGVQPGPGLWRVTRPTDDGEHVLWIMGQYHTLPKKMEWRSTELEAAIAGSQELLAEPEVDAEMGTFAKLGALPALVGVRNNPDGRRLEELMPIQLYARWLALKAEYLGYDQDVEKWRPIFAAFHLYRKAVDAAGLSYSPVVWPVAKKSAKKHRVKITTPTVSVKVEKPRALIKEFKEEPLDDLPCFASAIERLESDLGLLRARANAWATGDIAALRAMTDLNEASACIDRAHECAGAPGAWADRAARAPRGGVARRSGASTRVERIDGGGAADARHPPSRRLPRRAAGERVCRGRALTAITGSEAVLSAPKNATSYGFKVR